MILADKLHKLRTSSGLSQEQLAEKMNVSRQSISKWEAGSSIPTMEKIVDLSNIFGISTDYLLKDEIEELPEEIVADLGEYESVRKVSLEEANDFIARKNQTKNRIALGVMLCILSPVCLIALSGFSEMPNPRFTENLAAGIGVGILMVMVAVAVGLFILSNIATDKYQFLEKEDFTLDFAVEGILQKAEEEYLPAFYKSIAAGVVLCVISPVPLLIFSSAEDEITAEYMSVFGVAVLLTIVACGVFLIVRVCILKGAYDRLLQKGDYTVSKKRAGKKLNAFSGAYWSLLTALYLLVSFLTMRWDMTWIIWPVGAVAFAALYAILESVVADK